MKGYNHDYFDDALMKEIRARFVNVESDPYCGKRIYLESAGGSLRLKSVVEATARHTELPDNAGRISTASKEVDRTIEKGKEDIRLLLGVKSGIIFLGESTTGNAFRTLGAIMRNAKGKNIVTTNLDHPAIFDSTRILADRHKKEWKVAGLSADTGLVEPESILKHIDSETIVLAVIHSSNIIGVKNDIKKIIKKAREANPDIYILVDGAQHTPHEAVDVEELGCDVYLASSYKTFGKIGASAAYLSERASKLPHDRLLGKPDDHWELGTREHAGYTSWSSVVDYLRWLGMQFTDSPARREQILTAMNAIARHEKALTLRILRGAPGIKGLLDIPGVSVYGEVADMTVKEAVVIFNLRGKTSSGVVSYLGGNGITVHNRVSDAYSKHTLKAVGIEECVRVSWGHYNTKEEIDKFLITLRRAAE